MLFPLQLRFKLLAFAPQIYVNDAADQPVLYVHQKLFKLKEAVTVYTDETKQRPLCTLRADRMLDFSANYRFADMQGNPLGAVRRRGMRSLWSAHYEIAHGDRAVMEIHEENPWVKVLDSLLGQVPVLGALTGYFFNPSYVVSRTDGGPVLRLTKRPSFLESVYQIEQTGDLSSAEQTLGVLSLLMLLLLERERG